MTPAHGADPEAASDEIFTFAVAQLPFETPSPGGTTINVFCTLVPVWHEDWEPAMASEFPNNGLVWWKVQSWTRALAIPGRLLSARVERAPRYDESDPAKQLYQVVSSDITALMPEEGMEVLTVDAQTARSPRDLMNVAGVLTCDHPPTPEVLVRLSDWVYGPFRTRLLPGTDGLHRISLDPPAAQEGVQRLPASDMESAILRRDGVLVSRDSQPPTRSTHLASRVYEVLDAGSIAEFRRIAEPVVLPRDRDQLQALANQFLEAGERQRFTELLSRLDQAIAPQLPERRVLLEAIAREVSQKAASTLELARALLATGLLDRRLNEAVDAEVREQIGRRSAELEAQARQQQQDLLLAVDALDQRRDGLDEEIRTRIREAETLAQQRTEMAWAEHAQQVAAERAQLDAELARARGWEAPAAVLAPREAEPLDERAFFERFVDHVESSGFIFRDLDLQMFHVAMKSSELVLLTGAPGAGKSALGELYAEALAAADLRGAGPQQPMRQLRVSTRATWLETLDLLGQINPLTNRFQPASTGLYTQLIAAGEEYARFRGASSLWPIVLDDVDYAPMHLWFGEIFQAMRGSRRQRTLRVFSAHASDPESPFRAWHTLELSPAVRWIATFGTGLHELVSTLAGAVPTIVLRSEEDLHGGGASRGAPDGRPVHLADLERWSRDGPLGAGQVAALDAIAPTLARANAAIAPATKRLMRRLVSGSQQVLSADAAFDHTLAATVLRRVPLDATTIGRLLDIIEDLRIHLPESARVLEERRGLAEQHAI